MATAPDKANTVAKEELAVGSFVNEEGIGQQHQCKSRKSSVSLADVISLFTTVAIVALVRSLFYSSSSTSSNGCHAHTNLSNAQKAVKILSETPLIDGHNDLAILTRFLYHNKINEDPFQALFGKGGLVGHVDLPRLQAGRSGGAFWSAFMPCPANGSDFSEVNYAATVAKTSGQIDLIHRLTAAYPNLFSDSRLSSVDAFSAFDTDKKFISPIGIEGLHQIGNAASTIRLFHSLGTKYATLNHDCHNIFSDAALLKNDNGTTIKAPPLHHGVSDRGQLMIKEMNRAGIIVDLSHTGYLTMLDVLGGNPNKFAGSAAPVMFSHSSAYALCPHPRNVPDDILRLVKRTNSVVMVNFSPGFISCSSEPDPETQIPPLYPANATLHQVARHIIHIGDLIGYDHVGIGSDFDGIEHVPRGLEDVSKYPDLIAELLDLGVSESNVRKLVGPNILRVWGAVEDVADQLQRDGVLPLEDEVSGI